MSLCCMYVCEKVIEMYVSGLVCVYVYGAFIWEDDIKSRCCKGCLESSAYHTFTSRTDSLVTTLLELYPIAP